MYLQRKSTLLNWLLGKLLRKFLNLRLILSLWSYFETDKAYISMFIKHCSIYYYLWSFQYGEKKNFEAFPSSQLSITWDESRLEEAIFPGLRKHFIPLFLHLVTGCPRPAQSGCYPNTGSQGRCCSCGWPTQYNVLEPEVRSRGAKTDPIILMSSLSALPCKLSLFGSSRYHTPAAPQCWQDLSCRGLYQFSSCVCTKGTAYTQNQATHSARWITYVQKFNKWLQGYCLKYLLPLK